jgi:hypothetical protein
MLHNFWMIFICIYFIFDTFLYDRMHSNVIDFLIFLMYDVQYVTNAHGF